MKGYRWEIDKAYLKYNSSIVIHVIIQILTTPFTDDELFTKGLTDLSTNDGLHQTLLTLQKYFHHIFIVRVRSPQCIAEDPRFVASHCVVAKIHRSNFWFHFLRLCVRIVAKNSCFDSSIYKNQPWDYHRVNCHTINY